MDSVGWKLGLQLLHAGGLGAVGEERRDVVLLQAGELGAERAQRGRRCPARRAGPGPAAASGGEA